MIRHHRRSWPFAILAQGCEKYLRAWQNDDFYEFERNGEQFVLDRFRDWCGQGDYCVWDVGAHDGEWAREAHAALGEVRIISFELIAPIAERLAARSDPSWHETINVGLSDREEELDVVWNRDHDTTNSLRPRHESKWFQGENQQTTRARLRTADALIAEGLSKPTILKIDVEGAEAAVLRGASSLLKSADAPALIQFEYGQTWIPFGETLKGTYDLLTAAGYQLGRLYPNHAHFKNYEYSDDHFRMGNYVAVRDDRLRALIS